MTDRPTVDIFGRASTIESTVMGGWRTSKMRSAELETVPEARSGQGACPREQINALAIRPQGQTGLISPLGIKVNVS